MMPLDLGQRLEVFGLEAFLADIDQLISEAREVLIRARHRYGALEQVIVAIAALISRCERSLRPLIVPMSEAERLYDLVEQRRHVLLVLLGSAHWVLEGEAFTKGGLSAGIGMKPVKLLSLELNCLIKVKLWELELRFLQDLYGLD